MSIVLSSTYSIKYISLILQYLYTVAVYGCTASYLSQAPSDRYNCVGGSVEGITRESELVPAEYSSDPDPGLTDE